MTRIMRLTGAVAPKRRLVVVGNGMAGARAIEEVLTRNGRDLFDIVVFGAEPHGNYNRILLSGVLDGTQRLDEITLNSLAWYKDSDIRLHAGEAVTEIDRTTRTVRSAGGLAERYDVLVLATGSRPFVPPIAGAHDGAGRLKPGLFAYRTVDDAHAIREGAKRSRVAAVIGGGLLGLEAARALMALGCETHVVHLAGHLMEVQLDGLGGDILKSTLEKFGLKVHLDKATSAILGDCAVAGLSFRDGSTLACDMVVISAGIRPNAEIAKSAGLGVERAVVVDDFMRSVDDPNIYAVGECAQHRGRVYGLVAPVWAQARVFAEHVTGHERAAAYQGSKLATKLKVAGVELASMGVTEPADESDEVVQVVEKRRGTYKKLIVREGRLVGGILLGDISRAPFLLQAFDRGALLPDERMSLLFDLGGGAEKAVPIDRMPSDATICSCNMVSKAVIETCVESGRRTAADVMEATRAGMGCGSCRDTVAELVAWFGAIAAVDVTEEYYVQTIPLRRPDLMAAIRARELRSVAAVVETLGDRSPDRPTLLALAALLMMIWPDEDIAIEPLRDLARVPARERVPVKA